MSKVIATGCYTYDDFLEGPDVLLWELEPDGAQFYLDVIDHVVSNRYIHKGMFAIEYQTWFEPRYVMAKTLGLDENEGPIILDAMPGQIEPDGWDLYRLELCMARFYGSAPDNVLLRALLEDTSAQVESWDIPRSILEEIAG